ncbi:unnamed protein product [Amoebophrya sp. A25]|nr:unnamed protein product [Amoebophrya sp. A25]|eukprot:GSA25T00027829001.1
MFIPELFHSFASEIEARLNDLTTNFHEENRINDAAAGISDLQLQNADEPEFDAATGRSKEDAQNTLATQRKRELLSKCHAAFETELSKRLEKNIGETLKLLLSHLEWVANEAQISTVRGQLMQAWSDEVAPKLLQLHERLVLSASKSAGAALAGSSPGALSNASALSIHTAVSTDLSSDVKMGNAAVALVPTTSLEKTASTPAEALALAWQTNDLD